jgi:hypothetical protein
MRGFIYSVVVGVVVGVVVEVVVEVGVGVCCNLDLLKLCILILGVLILGLLILRLLLLGVGVYPSGPTRVLNTVPNTSTTRIKTTRVTLRALNILEMFIMDYRL